jgi:hypothetical protein
MDILFLPKDRKQKNYCGAMSLMFLPLKKTVQLTAQDLQQINEAAAKIPLEGERYTEALEELTGL